MSRIRRFQLWGLAAAALWAGAMAAAGAGFENFGNFTNTASAYTSGTFQGQDGSTWTYTSCRGDQIISPPGTPTLAKDKTPFASIVSGNLSNGCGTLSYDWMRPFASTCNVDVLINGVVRTNHAGGVTDATNHVDSFTINTGGVFTIEFRQHDLNAGQVSIDNIQWTSYGEALPAPPSLRFSPDTNHVLTAYGKVIQFDVTANEVNLDMVSLWAMDLPAGAVFHATNGPAPLLATFRWTPTSAQTGVYSIVFYAGDKDGTNSLAFSIEVTPIYPYYHYAMGLTGAVLKAKLHEIISTDTRQLNDDQENEAMKVLHTDPNNTNNVYYLYNVTSSVSKALYNDNNGWNKEHCWPESRGLGDEGPDQVDVHNLYAEDIKVNGLRAALFFDESDPADPLFRSPATNTAPQTSMDSNSFEPPPASKGNVARAIFYMATRYDGNDPETNPLYFDDAPANENLPAMGRLTTLLLWHAMDPPDAWESNRNEMIYASYQHNRNPFVDHPEWVEQIWGKDSDGDSVTDTHEIIAGTATNNPDSVFAASLSPTQIVCNLLSSGSVWRLYQGAFQSNDIVWQPVAETNRLQSGTLRFPVAPTGTATFYHLRALRP